MRFQAIKLSGMPQYKVEPNTLYRPKAVRGAYLYNLVDCLYTCILRRELSRARRAWAILVRCPDVNWRDRWGWALFLLTASSAEERAREEGEEDADEHVEKRNPDQDPYSQPTQSQVRSREPGEEALRFLRDIRIQSKEGDKPAVLAEIVLHLIAVGRYRDALEELTTYLLDFPYILSASLHTYAGMVCYYLAQPPSLRGGTLLPKPPTMNIPYPVPAPSRWSRRKRAGSESDESDQSERQRRETSADSSSSDDTVDPRSPAPDANLMRNARGWFAKALQIDPTEAVAKGFISLIDKPLCKEEDDMDLDESIDHSRESIEPSSKAESSRADSDLDMASPRPVPAVFDAGEYYSGSDWGSDEEAEEEEEEVERDEEPRVGGRRSARLSGAF